MNVNIYHDDKDVTDAVNGLKVYLDDKGYATLFVDWDNEYDVPEQLTAVVWIKPDDK